MWEFCDSWEIYAGVFRGKRVSYVQHLLLNYLDTPKGCMDREIRGMIIQCHILRRSI